MLEQLARRFHSWDLWRRDPDAVIGCRNVWCDNRVSRGAAAARHFCSEDCASQAWSDAQT